MPLRQTPPSYEKYALAAHHIDHEFATISTLVMSEHIGAVKYRGIIEETDRYVDYA